MAELSAFVTNSGKYNEGMLIGEWVTFPINEEEQRELFEKIGLCYYDENGLYHDTGYEEYFITDYEDNRYELGEYESIANLNELAEKLAGFDEDLVDACLELWNLSEVVETGADGFILYSDIGNDYELGYYWLVESGCHDLGKLGIIENYIDFDAFGKDVNLETDGGFTSYGYIERV